eukprot:Amastigsp_a339737_17.p4 type:complete len:130 gc:universal Amastigsp_a339737_17:484-95(-)
MTRSMCSRATPTAARSCTTSTSSATRRGSRGTTTARTSTACATLPSRPSAPSSIFSVERTLGSSTPPRTRCTRSTQRQRPSGPWTRAALCPRPAPARWPLPSASDSLSSVDTQARASTTSTCSTRRLRE